MELKLEAGSPLEAKTELLVIGAFSDGTLSPSAAAVDKASQGKITNVLKKHDRPVGLKAALQKSAGRSATVHRFPRKPK